LNALKGLALNLHDKITIGVTASVVIIAAVLLTLCIRYVDRRQKHLSTKGDSPESEEAQPYLQPKAELDLGQGRQELAAQESDLEMSGAGAMTEMSTGDDTRRPIHLGGTHELRGEEHSKELAVP